MRRRKTNVFQDIYNQPYNNNTRVKLYNSSKSSLQLIQRMSLLKRLKIHYGCVNSICWNSSGNLILSGSDDQHLVLTNAYNYQVLSDYKTSHRANIFSAKFLPNNGDHRIVSCSGDGIVLYTDLMRKTETSNNKFTCHSGTTYEVATIPCEPHNFLSCGEDGTVRWFDLRIKDKCNTYRCSENILIYCERAATAISVNPIMLHQIAIGCSDSTVRTYDRRMLGTKATGWTNKGINVKPLYNFTVPEFEGNSYRITSLSYSSDGQDVLVSYSSDHLYLFSTKEYGSIQLKKEITIAKSKGKRCPIRSPQPVRRLRLRGDWSDTGPDARPEREGGRRHSTAQARPVLYTSLMQRMTDVLSSILNDPATRAALSGGGEDSLEGVMDQQGESNQQNSIHNTDTSEERSSDIDEREQQSASNELSSNIESDISTLRNTESNQRNTNESLHETASSSNASSIGENFKYKSKIPIKIVSSSSVEMKNSNQSLTTQNMFQIESSREQNLNETESYNAENNHNSNSMMENLQDRLTTMRDGFLERHGSEPTVKLTYSDKSSTSATISLGVVNKIPRNEIYQETLEENSASNFSDPGPSNCQTKQFKYSTSQEGTIDDVYNDSDDEDINANGRIINSIETEMDQAIENARASQGLENFNENSQSDLQIKQKYMGHRNARTMIKEANFWGDNFVMSGSDCGHVFVWERDTAKLCMLLEADQHVVNCLQPHPFLPMLATSGIDYDVKLWAPINAETNFDEKFAEDLKKRNAVMLEETKDTITVPAAFMIRMLACLNQIRRGRGRNTRRSGDEE